MRSESLRADPLLIGITRRSDAPYEVYWDRRGVLAMTMPLPPMVYMGKAKQVMPGISSWEMVVVRTGIVLEIWAGANHHHNAIDVYHRIVLRNVRTPNRFWHNIVFGNGTEPVYWMQAKETVRSVRGL